MYNIMYLCRRQFTMSSGKSTVAGSPVPVTDGFEDTTEKQLSDPKSPTTQSSSQTTEEENTKKKVVDLSELKELDKWLKESQNFNNFFQNKVNACGEKRNGIKKITDLIKAINIETIAAGQAESKLREILDEFKKLYLVVVGKKSTAAEPGHMDEVKKSVEVADDTPPIPNTFPSSSHELTGEGSNEEYAVIDEQLVDTIWSLISVVATLQSGSLGPATSEINDATKQGFYDEKSPTAQSSRQRTKKNIRKEIESNPVILRSSKCYVREFQTKYDLVNKIGKDVKEQLTSLVSAIISELEETIDAGQSEMKFKEILDKVTEVVKEVESALNESNAELNKIGWKVGENISISNNLKSYVQVKDDDMDRKNAAEKPGTGGRREESFLYFKIQQSAPGTTNTCVQATDSE